jgi:hypothetical protein
MGRLSSGSDICSDGMGVRERHDPGTPSSGVAQVRTNVSSVTTGSTNVSLTAGSYVIGGVTYGWRSNALTASNPLAAGTKSYTVWAVDAVGNTGQPPRTASRSTTPRRPRRTSRRRTPVPRVARRPATRSSTPSASRSSRSPSWPDGAQFDHRHGSLISKGGSDRVQIWNSGNSAQLPVGTIMLNRTDYATKTSSFTGSSMVLAGNVLTVTLGTTISTSVTTAAGTGTTRFNASATITDLAGNAASTANCNESGTADVDF